MNVDDGKNYYDPGKPVEEAQINILIEALTGKSLEEMVRTAAYNPQGVQMPALNLAVADQIASEVSLPDGLPLTDIEQIIKDSDGFSKAVFPKSFMFKLLDGGKLEIRKFKKTASLGNGNNSANSNDKPNDNPQPSTPKTTLQCSGTTVVTNQNFVVLYLYSSKPGSAIELNTGASYFPMRIVTQPQEGWPLIRAGYANVSWGQQPAAAMRVTLADGTLEECVGALEHQ